MTTNTEFILTIEDEESACLGEDTMWVYVTGGPLSVTIDASSTEICEGEMVNLFAYPSGGSENYTYSWTSDPPGFVSDVRIRPIFRRKPPPTTSKLLMVLPLFPTTSPSL